MPKLLKLPEAVDLSRYTHGFHDDFYDFTTGDKWSTVASDDGSAAVGDAAGGVLTLSPSDSVVADNDEIYIKGTHETLLFAADKPIDWVGVVKFAEANTDDANVIAGFLNAVAADCLVNDGGGPKSSFSGAVFYKVDGGTKWVVASSIGTSRLTNTTTGTAGGSAYQRLEIKVHTVTSTEVEVTYFIDGAQCIDNTSGLKICHRFAFSGATEMQPVFGVKNGGANEESLLIDFASVYQGR